MEAALAATGAWDANLQQAEVHPMQYSSYPGRKGTTPQPEKPHNGSFPPLFDEE